jgi:hypothetical protein
MRAAISLIADLNSLQGREKFSFRMRRKLAHNALIYCLFFSAIYAPRRLESMKFPVFGRKWDQDLRAGGAAGAPLAPTCRLAPVREGGGFLSHISGVHD